MNVLPGERFSELHKASVSQFKCPSVPGLQEMMFKVISYIFNLKKIRKINRNLELMLLIHSHMQNPLKLIFQCISTTIYNVHTTSLNLLSESQ